MRLDEASLVPWLERAGVLEPGSGARVERAGRGNLNFVRRVLTGRGASYVVKHARPHAEDFPQFALPSERIAFEARYARIARELLAEDEDALVPEIHCFDPSEFVLVMEDLHDAVPLDALLSRGEAPRAALERLGAAFAAIHARSARRASELAPQFDNAAMRGLNGVQMFEAPYAGQVPGLETELEAVRQSLIRDEPLRGRVAALARSYRESREALVHGDPKAPNVLLQGDRPRLIDAEFAHMGDPAFDLGVALGHLFLHTAAPPTRAALEPAWDAVLRGYLGAGGSARSCERAARYAGAVAIAHVVGPSRVAFASAPDALEVARRGRELLS